MLRVLVVAFLFHFSVSAQVVHRTYYNKDGSITDSVNSYSYSEIESNAIHRLSSYYSATKKVRSREITDSLGTKKFYYHENESVKAEIMLDKFGLTQSVKMFYPDGKRQAELGLEESLFFVNLKRRPYILNYWDSAGQQIVKEGNGRCTCVLNPEEDEPFIESGSVIQKVRDGIWTGEGVGEQTFEENYKSGRLVEGTFHDGNGQVYTYTEVKTPARPSEGMPKFYLSIIANLKYPLRARRMGIEGKVFVEFVVQKDGSVTNVRVLKGIFAECDAEAVRVLRASKNWDPGIVRGKNTEERYILPIDFKLQ